MKRATLRNIGDNTNFATNKASKVFPFLWALQQGGGEKTEELSGNLKKREFIFQFIFCWG
jgi:hypothetical protein